MPDHPPADDNREPARPLREALSLGDASALDQIVVAFYRDVLRYAMTVLRNDEAACEATQETFLRILELHRKYDPARPFRPWLFGVCRLVCRELRRRATRQAARVVDLGGTDDDSFEPPDDALLAVERLIREQEESRALAALADLEGTRREVIYLHLFEGLPFREIAAIAERPLPTVTSIYYRGLEELRRNMQEPPSAMRGARNNAN